MELGSQGIRVHNQFLSVAPDKPRDSSVTCCFALGIPLQKNQQVGISTGYKSLQLLLGTENVESFQEKKIKSTLPLDTACYLFSRDNL